MFTIEDWAFILVYIFTGQDGNLAELEAKLEELQKDHDALIAQKSKTDSLLQQCQQQLQGTAQLFNNCCFFI